jgi:hypothetical protein
MVDIMLQHALLGARLHGVTISPPAGTGLHRAVEIDPLLGEAGAAAMVELCERFGGYGMYSQEHVDSEIGRGLSQRHDAAMNFIRTGGRFGRVEPVATLAARTNYFREEYAYGTRGLIDGIEPYLHHEGFREAAKEIFGRPIVEPAIVFANLMVPGQELAVHTDVPEFRGCNRKVMPQWLLVAMHHSGLFDEWRIPIATGVAWYHDCDGGEFAYWPAGADHEPLARPARYDNALVLDTDSVFHGVDRVAPSVDELPPLKPGMHLRPAGRGRWAVEDDTAARPVVEYRWDELRFSVSWKGYCFADDAERAAWAEHRDELTIGVVVDRLVADLRERGRIRSDDAGQDAVPGNPDLALMIIDEYIRFPQSAVGRN